MRGQRLEHLVLVNKWSVQIEDSGRTAVDFKFTFDRLASIQPDPATHERRLLHQLNRNRLAGSDIFIAARLVQAHHPRRVINLDDEVVDEVVTDDAVDLVTE